jgi:hypothetical protein
MRGGHVIVVLVTLVTGCGARTSLSIAPAEGDGGQRALDAGPRDAGRDDDRDGGPRDGATRDAGPERPCTSDRDCAPATVCRAAHGFAPADLEPVPLACGALDRGAPVGGDCVARSDCDRGLCAIAGACVKPCVRDGDCELGERCQEIWVPTSGASMQSLSGCAPIIAAPPGVRVMGPESGPTLGGADPTRDALTSLDDGTLVVWTALPDTGPFIERITTRGAAPEIVFDAFVSGPGAPTPDWGVSAATITDVVTLLFPNGPNTPRSPAGFDVQLRSQAATSTERVVLRREGEGALYDIDAYLVGGGGWTSEAGRVPPAVALLVREMNDLYAGTGVRVGEVRVHAIVGGLRSRFQVLEGSSGLQMVPPDLPELYRLSAGARRPSVHVFFVRSIDGALGIASGIPGPHTMPGTGASGVAIAVDLTPREQLAGVVVHEIGHFMGLFHTSELDGSVVEPLTDTEECRSDRDFDGDGMLLPMECRGAGADNVMFWASEDAEISPQQAEIMRRALFVQ